CDIEDTLQKLSALAEIEIPDEEYVEQPALGRKTVAQLVHAHKEENVTDANAKASGAFETNLPGQINAISDVADKL
ncbi:MAG: hypothetical protein IJR39_06760, partial [Treponema sp.]|nr:hypothetical protein [Treponema sp.]